MGIPTLATALVQWHARPPRPRARHVPVACVVDPGLALPRDDLDPVQPGVDLRAAGATRLVDVVDDEPLDRRAASPRLARCPRPKRSSATAAACSTTSRPAQARPGSSAKNRVTFASEAEADKAGYRKGGDCW